MSSVRRAGRSTSSRKKAITTATLLAIGGLASTYMQVLRPTAAYATACTTVTDETGLGLAIADVNAGTCDTITFATNASINLTADLAPINLTAFPGAQSLTIVGSGATINGGDLRRAFDVTVNQTDSVTVSDLTLTHMHTSGSGSAISMHDAGPAIPDLANFTISDVTFTNNYSYAMGGAVYAKYTDLTITGSVFEDNTAHGSGGALTITKAGSTLISDTTFGRLGDDTHGNETLAGYGGAVILNAGPYTSTQQITDSAFVGNSSYFAGGALFEDAELTITRSSFIANFGRVQGGALTLNTASTVTIDSSSFVRNHSNVYGGTAIVGYNMVINNSSILDSYGSGSTVMATTELSLAFSTIAGNHSDVTGAATVFTSADLTATASVIMALDSVSPACFNYGTGSIDYSVVSDNTCGATSSTNSITNATDADINLSPLVNEDVPGGGSRYPLPGSVLTSAAPSTNLGTGITVDQIGTARGAGSLSGLFDIGARQAFTPPVPTTPPHRPLQPSVRAGHKPGTAVVTVTRGTGGGTPTRFRVTARVAGTTTPVATCRITATDAGTCVLTGLTPGVKYAISATASNPDGTSAASRATALTLPVTPVIKVPGAPASLHAMAMPDSSMLHWTDPANNGGAKIRSFAVGFRLANVPGFTEYRTTKGHAITVGGLVPGCVYRFSVAATNAAGTGKPRISDPVRIPSPLRGDITCRLLS